MGWRLLRLPAAPLPAKARVYLKHWDASMMWLVLRSLGRRSFIDQPCRMTVPASFEPKAAVDEAYRLTPGEIRDFYTRGFLEPFTVLDGQKAAEVYRTLRHKMTKPSRIFGFPSVRDRHLDSRALMGLIQQPAIVERAAQLLGPDLLCWRSQIFAKAPGGAPIHWHQASTYLVEDRFWPILEPPDRDRLFQLTAWIALTPSNEENGCLAFIPGSHRRINTIRPSRDHAFYHAAFDLDFREDPRLAVPMVMEPGQCVLFSERVIHGSGENRTAETRFAVNFRIVPCDVAVYRGKSHHFTVHRPDEKAPVYPLAKWGVVTLRGRDRHGLNRHFRRREARRQTRALPCP